MENIAINKLNNKYKFAIYFIICNTILEEFLISMLHFPTIIRYCNDAIIICTFIMVFKSIKKNVERVYAANVLNTIYFFILILLCGVLINGVNPLCFIWAIRNTFRILIFYLLCISLLGKADIFRIISILYHLQGVNLILSLIQLYVIKVNADHVGGIFGINQGCNSFTNIYLCILLSFVICCYLNNKCSMKHVLVTFGCSISVAAIAELKIIYIEIMIITILAVLINKKSKRTTQIIIAVIVLMVIGLLVLRELQPWHYGVLTNKDRFLEYINGNEGGYKLSRSKAFSNINELFFKNDVVWNLFGLGFGNCEYSSFSFFVSDFYKEYGYYNYRWFMHQMTFLESGILGVVSYLSILVSICLSDYKGKKIPKEYNFMRHFTCIMVVIACINFVYNSSLREEPGYLLFFALASASTMNKAVNSKEEVCADAS